VAATFLPRNLAVYYPYRSDISVLEAIGATGLLAIISGFAFGFAKRRPWLLVGWLWYLGTLVPVIGLVQVGDQAWADRYTYLPLIGLFVAIVWGLAELPSSARVPFVAAPIVAMSLTLIIISSFQLRYWKNSQTLFAHAAHVTRNNHMAITLLGSLLAKEGKLDEAMEHYRTALRYQPNYPEAHFFLGNALDLKGDLEGAIAEYRQALWFKPTQEQTHLFLAAALAKQAKTEEAITHYLAALKLNPESAIAHQNLARLLQTEGRLDEAIDHYFCAIRLAPSLAQAHNNLGVLLLQNGRLAEGTVQLREALRLNPGNVESEYNLALALNQQGRWAEAARVLAPLVGTKLDDANAHYQLGLALAHEGKTRETMSHYARALLLNADFPQALNQLAWILATDARPEVRNGMQALGMAQRACELTQQGQAPYLATLAAACAEAGQFNEAIQAAQKARALATAKQQKELVTQCDAMIAAFQLKRPWR
jgi:tetratricopeptide (TPR) repeat protein